jgi:hypothetical protein
MCSPEFANSCQLRSLLYDSGVGGLHPRDVIIRLSGAHLDNADERELDAYPEQYDPLQFDHFSEVLAEVLAGKTE